MNSIQSVIQKEFTPVTEGIFLPQKQEGFIFYKTLLEASHKGQSNDWEVISLKYFGLEKTANWCENSFHSFVTPKNALTHEWNLLIQNGKIKVLQPSSYPNYNFKVVFKLGKFKYKWQSIPTSFQITTSSRKRKLNDEETDLKIDEIYKKYIDLMQKYLDKYNIFDDLWLTKETPRLLNISGTTLLKIKEILNKENFNSEHYYLLIASKIFQLIKSYNIPLFERIEEEKIKTDFINLKEKIENKSQALFKLDSNASLYFQYQEKQSAYSLNDPNNQLQAIVLPAGLSQGKQFSNDFFISERLKAKNINGTSVLTVWRNDSLRRGKISSIVKTALKNYKSSSGSINFLNQKSLYNEFKRGCGISCQFRPAIPPAIISILINTLNINPQSKWKVLDPCLGWGDRLTGLLADNRVSHLAVNDVNSNCVTQAQKLIDCTEKFFEIHKKVIILNKQAEHLSPQDFDQDGFGLGEIFDLVITSPPYFLADCYPGENQSSQYMKGVDKNRALINWCEKFIYPMIDNTGKMLKPGGIWAINIDDTKIKTVQLKNKEEFESFKENLEKQTLNTQRLAYTNGGKESKDLKPVAVYSTCNLVNQYFKSKGYEYVGTTLYEMSKGYRSKSQSTLSGEPIFIWRKPLTMMHTSTSH